MGTNTLKMKVLQSPVDAPTYSQPEWVGLNFDAALVVLKGTDNGRPTIDLQFTGPDGQKYIAMVTAGIIQAITVVAATQSLGPPPPPPGTIPH